MQHKLTKQEEKAYAELAKAAKRVRQLQQRRERQRKQLPDAKTPAENCEVTPC